MLVDAKDIMHARSYFNDEKGYAKHFVKLDSSCTESRVQSISSDN
jgi:hypothetical protein